MLVVGDKDSAIYQLIYDRYAELKTALASLGVNLIKIDKIEG